MPDTPSPVDKREGNERIPKKGGKLEKYKWYLIGGLALVAALVFFFVNKSKANAQGMATGQTPAGTPPGVDPQTGVPYSVEMGEYGAGAYGGFGGIGSGAAGTGAAGPAGPAGTAGTPGARGPRGKPGPAGKGGKGGDHDNGKKHHH